MEEELEKIWIKEFQEMMNQRKSTFPTPNLVDVKIPESITNTPVANYPYCKIEGVTEGPYKQLNGTYCELWKANDGPMPTLVQRVMDKTTNKWIKKPDGSYQVSEYKLPTGSRAVITTMNIQVKLEEKYDGFDYVDMFTNKATNTIYRVYVIPEQYIYEINNTALVLCFTRNKNTRAYYSGVEVSFVNGQRMCLQVVPYPLRGSQRQSQRVLAVKPSSEFSEEYRTILQYWVKNEIMFDPKYCDISMAAGRGELINFTNNMAYGYMPQIRDYEEYKKGGSIAAETQNTAETDWEDLSSDAMFSDFIQED